MRTRSILLASLVFVAACRSTTPSRHAGFVDLGTWSRPIGTSNAEAQRWFDQGLAWCYAFNHDAAIRAFHRAAELDPESPMPWWGIALADGPHINNPSMAPDRVADAWKALGEARRRIDHARPEDRGLIDALAARYAADPPDDRGPLDRAYAEAMVRLQRDRPDDADVAALTVEALMDLQPWDLWKADGAPKGRASEIVTRIERLLASRPEHPLANHLYIHAVEASRDPGRGKDCAKRLESLVPEAGHMVHMPAHIWARVGEWTAAARANEQAIEADAHFRELVPRDGFYRVYMAHNEQFLTFASMMEGRSEVAQRAAQRMVDEMPAEFLAAAGPLVDGFLPIVEHVLVRFGKWDEILARPGYPAEMVAANAIHHYARGVAFTAQGKLGEASRELAELTAAVNGMDERAIGNNAAKAVLQVPLHLLGGELRFRRGEVDGALAEMRAAVEAEDALRYDEPPDWMMPSRHAYGAMLLEAQRWDDAEHVFRDDLRTWPENGWSLFGLSRALRGEGRAKEAGAIEKRFAAAWKRADVEIRSPCFCQPGNLPATAR